MQFLLFQWTLKFAYKLFIHLKTSGQGHVKTKAHLNNCQFLFFIFFNPQLRICFLIFINFRKRGREKHLLVTSPSCPKLPLLGIEPTWASALTGNWIWNLSSVRDDTNQWTTLARKVSYILNLPNASLGIWN